MASLTIDEVRFSGEPQRDYCFEVILPTFNNLLPPFTGQPAPHCESIEGSFYSVEPEAYLINGREHYIAGDIRLNKFTGIFFEDEKNTAEQWYNSWLLRIRDPLFGTYFPPLFYKRTITVKKMSIDGQTVISTRSYIGSFPVSALPYKFASAFNDRVVMQAEFVCDEIKSGDTVLPIPIPGLPI